MKEHLPLEEMIFRELLGSAGGDKEKAWQLAIDESQRLDETPDPEIILKHERAQCSIDVSSGEYDDAYQFAHALSLQWAEEAFRRGDFQNACWYFYRLGVFSQSLCLPYSEVSEHHTEALKHLKELIETKKTNALYKKLLHQLIPVLEESEVAKNHLTAAEEKESARQKGLKAKNIRQKVLKAFIWHIATEEWRKNIEAMSTDKTVRPILMSEMASLVRSIFEERFPDHGKLLPAKPTLVQKKNGPEFTKDGLLPWLRKMPKKPDFASKPGRPK